MRLCSISSVKLVLVSVILALNCSVFVAGFPQWVWNPDANSRPLSGTSGSGSNVVFTSNQSPAGSTKDIKVSNVELSDTQARLFPRIISAISNTINGGGSGGSSSSSSSGGSSSISCSSQNSAACTIAQTAIQSGISAGSAIVQNPSVTGILGSLVNNIFGGGAQTLPANLPDNNKDPGSSSGGSSGGSCNCVNQNSCFLPNKEAGSCDGGRVNCCSSTRGTRTLFPDDISSLNGGTRSVTRSQIRRGLLKNIVRDSTSVIDDTIDLILHPFLTKEDQRKVATRIINEG